MECKAFILSILRDFGIYKTYKGAQYILSAINFIYCNENTFSPITKILYVEVANDYNTSSYCVEKNIRSVIEHIWIQKENQELICEIFGNHYINKRPSNAEFLTHLYEYYKYHNGEFMCPILGIKCAYNSKCYR